MPEPLALVLTRPAAQALDFADALEARRPGRFRILFAPLLEIVDLAGAADLAGVDLAAVDLAGVGGLAFTSANGVRAFAAASPARELPAWCVGDLTAAAATRAGFADVASAGGDVAALASLVAARHPRAAGAVLHVRGRHAAGDLVAALAALGVPARPAEIYDQRPLPLGGRGWEALAGGGAVAVFSPRTALLLARQAADGGRPLSRATAVSLSPAADAALGEAGFGRRLVAARPDREAMLEALAALG